MPRRNASATDAAAIIVSTGTPATAQWPDLVELLQALRYVVTPTVWYYTLGDHGAVVGLDAAQRSRTGFNLKTFFCNAWPGKGRPTEHDAVASANRFGSDLYLDFADGLSVALSGSGHGLVGAVTVAKKFPGSPSDIGSYYCAPIEYTVPHHEGMVRFSNTFWRVGPGSMVTSPAGKTTFVPSGVDGATDQAAVVGLWYWLEKQKFMAAFKPWVRGTSAAPQRRTKERTIEHTGTCGICLGNFKMNRGGGLVLHGYERKGYGWLSGECSGVGYPPYEVSDAACKAFADRLERSIADAQRLLEEFKQALATNTLTELPDSRNGRPGNTKYNPPVKPGEPRWEIELRSYPHGLEERIKGLTNLGVMNYRLLRLWELRPLPGEPGHKSITTLLFDQHAKERSGYAAVRLRGKVYPVES